MRGGGVGNTRRATKRALGGLALGALLASLLIVATTTEAQAAGVAYSLYDLPNSPWAPGTPVVALTIDDGPSPDVTAGVLDVLRDRNVKATFFPVGSMAVGRPYLVQ